MSMGDIIRSTRRRYCSVGAWQAASEDRAWKCGRRLGPARRSACLHDARRHESRSGGGRVELFYAQLLKTKNLVDSPFLTICSIRSKRESCEWHSIRDHQR